MSVALYPGSFNPWHKGHEDILKQALKVFDRVIIAIGVNPDKPELILATIPTDIYNDRRVDVRKYNGLLSDFVKELKADVVVRGLRNGQDFEYEKIQQYWNEDLGITVPTFYIIANRSLVHISSSAIKQVEKFK